VDLAYDGRELHGFADQPGHPTVAGLLRSSLATVLRLAEPPLLTVAGRTDAGVHALGQVCHLDLPVGLLDDPDGVTRRLNGLLAGRVVVRALTPVDDDFHARFSAIWRSYRYLVVASEHPALALTRDVAWVVRGPLDGEAMNEGFAAVLGEHDFRAFCKRPPHSTPDDPLRRHLYQARWRAIEDTAVLTAAGDQLWRCDITANAFCHNMVRSLVATAVAVGQGRLAPGVFSERLESHVRDHLPALAPASGLTLVKVGYPGDLPPGVGV